MKTGKLLGISKDILGGTSSAIISLSGNIIFGIIAFSPLGSAYLLQGIMAGFYCSIIVGLISSLIGGSPGMVSGPRASITLIFSSVLMLLIKSGYLDSSSPEYFSIILGFGFLTIFFAGLIQTTFGLFGLGRLIKFISYPVIAGFLNGSAILIILSQFWIFFGVPKQDSFLSIINVFHLIKPLNIFIVLFTSLIMWIANKISKKLPSAIISLIIGTSLFHLLTYLGLSKHLGSVIGRININIPTPHYILEFYNIITGNDFIQFLPILIPAALSIAILSSTDSLLTSLSIQNVTDKKPDANRVLVGHCLGNILSACFGGIAGGGSITRSMANIQAGSRTRLSSFVNVTLVVIIIYTMPPLLALIPKAVIAGIVIVFALQMFNKWSLQITRNLFFKKNINKIKLFADYFSHIYCCRHNNCLQPYCSRCTRNITFDFNVFL